MHPSVLSTLVGLALATSVAHASSHREAPLTALDHKADITDVYAFVSPDRPDTVTMIMNVDPLLEPGNGPTLFPFDPEIRYEINIDNDHDGRENVTYRFAFRDEIRNPALPLAALGFGPLGLPRPGTTQLVVPRQIRSLSDPGLNLSQTYLATRIEKDANGNTTSTQTLRTASGDAMRALPGNAGPRTMDYPALRQESIYDTTDGARVFAGTTDDPFFIDLGGVFDTFNARPLGSGIPGVLSDAEDQAEANVAPDFLSGFNVNAIAIQVPIADLTRSGQQEPATSPDATIGVWATTSRPAIKVLGRPTSPRAKFRQVQRLGNPLVNELIIGIGSKDRFSRDKPDLDGSFLNELLDPPIARIVEALYGGSLQVPGPPRFDMAPLLLYVPPIVSPQAAASTPMGPVADLLRLNVGVPPTPYPSASRLGLIGGDSAGFPNGRRVFDDVVDVVLRVGVGGVLTLDPSGQPFDRFPNNRLGDGVNVNDVPFQSAFPYLAPAHSGRERQHIDPGEDLGRSNGGVSGL